MRVLVTRPRFDAARTAARLIALGHEAVTDPVIEIEPIAFTLEDVKAEALAFTSANAVRIASDHARLKHLPTFCVGARTAEVARECGFEHVRIAGGDVIALGDLIRAELQSGAHILHLAGEDRAGDLPGALARNGIVLETRVVYRAKVSERLCEETVAAFRAGQIDAVLHYSERSAGAFVRLAAAAGLGEEILKTRHLCLSSAVAGPLKILGAEGQVAASPDEAALLALLD